MPSTIEKPEEPAAAPVMGAVFGFDLGVVPPEWIDANGHMNVLHYLEASERATTAFYEFLGVGAHYRAHNRCGIFAAEHHIAYRAELREGDPLQSASVLADFDEKRMHFVNRLHRGPGGEIAATIEHVELHVDLVTRRVCPFRAGILERLGAVRKAHAALASSCMISRQMSLQRRPASL